MALSALYSQRARSDLPKACHSILHSPATSIKEEKKNTLLLQVLSFPHYFLPLLDFLPPIISLFQICNLLFIFFFVRACVSACALLAVAQCTLLKCIFPNHSSKADCLPREPQPSPTLQEITGRLSRARQHASILQPLYRLGGIVLHCCTFRDQNVPPAVYYCIIIFYQRADSEIKPSQLLPIKGMNEING